MSLIGNSVKSRFCVRIVERQPGQRASAGADLTESWFRTKISTLVGYTGTDTEDREEMRLWDLR